MSESYVVRSRAALASVAAGERRLTLAVYLLLMAGALVPILSVQVAPMADYVNHLARMHVITAGDQDPGLYRFYEIHWQVIPNLVMDAVVPPLARLSNVYVAGQIFVALNLLAMIGGVVFLHHAWTGRLSPWPLVTFLFLYNHAFLYGFMNFVFASAIALWALGAWIRLRGADRYLRAGVSALFVVLLFFCHLFGIGMYGLGLIAYEAWHWRSHRGASLWREFPVVALPFLPVLPLMAVSPTMKLAQDANWDWTAKLDGLGWLVQAYGQGLDAAFGIAVLTAVMLGIVFRVIRIHPAGQILLGAGVVVYVAMPTTLFGSWAADLRLPVALVFMLIGLSELHLKSVAARKVFMAVVAILAILRVSGVQSAWTDLDHNFEDVRASLGFIDPGSKILVASADRPVGTEEMNLPLSHAACLAMIERSSMVSTAFTVSGKQVLNVRPEFAALADSEDGDPPSVSQLLTAARATPEHNVPAGYWQFWPDRFDYVFVLYTAPGDANPIPDRLDLLYEGQGFQLYEVVPPVRPDISR